MSAQAQEGSDSNGDTDLYPIEIDGVEFEANRLDPTGSQTLQKNFAAAFHSRWRAVRGDIHETVVSNDALRLGDRDSADPSDTGPLPRARSLEAVLSGGATQTLRPSDFAVRDDHGARVDVLSDWVEFVLAERVLDPIDRRRRQNGEHWTGEYVRNAYVKGDRRGVELLRDAGYRVPSDRARVRPSELVSEPMRQESIHGLYADTYHDVRTATDATRSQMVRQASTALGGAASASAVASEMRDRVVHEGMPRSDATAAYRTVDAVNRGALDRYAQAGVTSVSPIVELLTAGDQKVCEDCAPREGEFYPLEAVRSGNIEKAPYHPHCRCLLAPR